MRRTSLRNSGNSDMFTGRCIDSTQNYYTNCHKQRVNVEESFRQQKAKNTNACSATIFKLLPQQVLFNCLIPGKQPASSSTPISFAKQNSCRISFGKQFHLKLN